MNFEDNAWGAMVTMNLPWLNDRNQSYIRENEKLLKSLESDLKSVENHISHEVLEAFLRSQTLKRSVKLLENDLVPKTRQELEVARARYETQNVNFIDLIDAQRRLKDIEILTYKTLAEYLISLADLERALGQTADLFLK